MHLQIVPGNIFQYAQGHGAHQLGACDRHAITRRLGANGFQDARGSGVLV